MQGYNIKSNKDLIVMIMALGDAYLDKGLYAEAIKRYTMLIENKIANKRIYTNLSKALIGLKRHDREALAIYQRAIEYDPTNIDVYHILAKSFLKDERTDDEALQIYDLALKTHSPDFERIADFLSQLYYGRGDFAQCQVVTRSMLNRLGNHERAVTYFVDCSWKTRQYQDAVNELKKLIDQNPQNEPLLKYLCLTYLEKSHHGFLEGQPPKFSYVDRQFAKDYVQIMPKFEHLQDLALYLELQRFLTNTEYWGNLELLETQQETELILQNAHGQGHQGGADPGHHIQTRNRHILERLSSFEKISEYGAGSRSELTFEDFQKQGAEIFSQPEIGAQGFHLPEDCDIIVTIELSNFEQLRQQHGLDATLRARNKLIFALLELMQKYEIRQIWATTSGFLIFDKNVINSATMSVDLLNKINRQNFLDDAEQKLHVSIGIHHAREMLSAENENLLRELSVGVKLGIVNEADLPEDDRPMYAKVFQKTDRILISSRAYREIKSSKQFRVSPIGQFRLKYLNENLSIHEVSWRNPIDDLKFGYIRKLGRFDLLAEIGDRGAIRVFKAKDPDLQRFVILKVIQSEMFNALPDNNPHKIEFYQIARSLAQMNHPNIAAIYDVDNDQGLTYIVRQFIEGQPMTDYVKQQPAFSVELFIKIIYQIFKALQYCHRLGYHHLNLKPNNIRVGANHETKIMDFLIPGSAMADFSNRITDEQRAYLSPEQLQGQKADSRSDLFSLGVVMYETVAFRHPFADHEYANIAEAILHKKPVAPSELNPKVPRFCDALILKCLAKNPENRVQSAEQIVTLLKKNFERTLFSNFNYQIAQSRNTF